MNKYLRIGLIVLGVIILIAGVVVASMYKRDLSREELSDVYMNENSKFMKLENGAEMHYRDEGNPNGKVIVMIHGGFGSLQNWEGWVENLDQDYRLISMDILGHGLTGLYPQNDMTRPAQMEAIRDLLSKLGVEKYTVAGNSFGGGIALELTLAYPDEVEGLILVDSEGVPNGEEGYDVSTLTDEKPVSPDEPGYSSLSWLESFGSKFISRSIVKDTLKGMFANHELLTDDYVDYFYNIVRHDGNRAAQILMFRQGLYFISQADPMDLKPRLPEIKCPTLVMHGGNDTLVPLRVSKVYDEMIVDSELVIIDNAGHMPMIEKPAESAEAVKAFMK